MPEMNRESLRVVGLFAGIGGIELGMDAAGHRTELLCEVDEPARRVLNSRFSGVEIHDDIRTLGELPVCDVLTAGFPCQDLSQAGRTAGIMGDKSGLVEEVFRLIDNAEDIPRWLFLENVPFMLSLDRGGAMRWLTQQLDSRGFRWAYRVVDSMAFGLPQRRRRVLMLASREMDPRAVLLNSEECPEIPSEHHGHLGCGFYWTEGLRGLGWAIDAVPTLKGGSTIGIPSPPAIWVPGSSRLITPHLNDVERLQGFPADWTIAADDGQIGKRTDRWKLVGNAVSVPVAEWVGKRLTIDEPFATGRDTPFEGDKWPKAGWGHEGTRRAVETTMWPVRLARPHLNDFLLHEPAPLSARATAGFLSRAQRGTLRIPEDLTREARKHLEHMTPQAALAA